jgi:hypothetical protein
LTVDVSALLCYNPAVINSSQEQDPMPQAIGALISVTYFYFTSRAHRLVLFDGA